jgi:hypothetical protein
MSVDDDGSVVGLARSRLPAVAGLVACCLPRRRSFPDGVVELPL